MSRSAMILSRIMFVVATLSTSPAWASWWCATNFYNERDQVCRSTKEACESMESATAHYMDCREEQVVTILDVTQVNSGPKFVAFPRLSQCEKARGAFLKNKVDYRNVSKCYSSASLGTRASEEKEKPIPPESSTTVSTPGLAIAPKAAIGIPDSLLLAPNTDGCKALITGGPSTRPTVAASKVEENNMWCSTRPGDVHGRTEGDRPSVLCVVLNVDKTKPGLFAMGSDGKASTTNMVGFAFSVEAKGGWSAVFDPKTVVLSNPRDILIIYPPDKNGLRGYIFHSDTFMRVGNSSLLSAHNTCTGYATDPGPETTNKLLNEFVNAAPSVPQ
jgi:hypothetical protein